MKLFLFFVFLCSCCTVHCYRYYYNRRVADTITKLISYRYDQHHKQSNIVSNRKFSCDSISNIKFLQLQSTSNNNNDPELASPRGMKGYYRRPSKAIEKGGGFFVPGLEGERVRIISATFLIGLFVVNHNGTVIYNYNQTVSEVIGLLMSFLLLLQGILLAFPTVNSNSYDNSSSSYLSVVQADDSFQRIEAIGMVAKTVVQSCENINYITVISSTNNSNSNSNSNSRIVFELGPISSSKSELDNSAGVDSVGDSVQSLSIGEFLNTNALAKKLSLPTNTNSVTLCKDISDNVWVIGSTNSKGSMTENSSWIKSLMLAPV